jgi:hypothetical protein
MVRFPFPEPDGTALVKLSSIHIGSRQFYAEALARGARGHISWWKD